MGKLLAIIILALMVVAPVSADESTLSTPVYENMQQPVAQDTPVTNEANCLEMSGEFPDELSIAQGGCCKVCRKGKACGDSCISRNYTCSRPSGCACNG